MQNGELQGNVKTRIRIIIISAAALAFGASIFTVSSAPNQLSLFSRAISPSIETPDDATAPSVRGSTFSHSTRAHREGKYASCESCHAIPTRNWATARKDPYPDVKNYPYHPSCFGCHAKDVYSNGGAFCGTCHTEASMRARGGAGVLPFPIKSHAMQFTTIFPHDLHQNLIASDTTRNDVALGHFMLASFAINATPTPTPAAAPAPVFYNCAICHKTITQMPKYVPRKITGEKSLADATADTFTALSKTGADFFKDGPDSHASCFTCHYQRVKPAAYDCAGCHRLTEPYFEKKAIERYSLKFSHSTTNHVNKDCTTCHVRITQNSDISKMKDADVPFQTCSTSSCHGSNIEEETKKREASSAAKQPAFQCSYCHTTAVGRYDIPPSHRKY